MGIIEWESYFETACAAYYVEVYIYIGHKTKCPVVLYALPGKYLLSADGDITEANE